MWPPVAVQPLHSVVPPMVAGAAQEVVAALVARVDNRAAAALAPVPVPVPAVEVVFDSACRFAVVAAVVQPVGVAAAEHAVAMAEEELQQVAVAAASVAAEVVVAAETDAAGGELQVGLV